MTGFDRLVDIPLTYGGLKTGLPADHQSVRWSGEIFLATPGDYTFFSRSLALQRLTINDVAVIDDFTGPRGSQTEKSGLFSTLMPGWVSIVYEVAEPGSPNTGPMQVRLEWTAPDAPSRRVIRAQETSGAGAAAIASPRQVLRYQSNMRTTGADDDFHLSSANGSWHGGTFTPDAVDSPALDSGDPLAGFATEPVSR